MLPFTVTITAVDGAGAPVAGYSGPATLSALGGAAVPPEIGLFVNGRWTGLVEVRAPRAAEVLHVEDGLGHSGDSSPFDVAPVPAARLRFTTPPRDLEAGGCSEEIGLRLEDAFGHPTTAAAPVAVALAPAALDVLLFEDAACVISLGAAIIAAGEGTLAVHARGTRAGSSALPVSAPALAGDAQPIAVHPGPASAVAFVTTPRVSTAGSCSDPITAEVRDAFGNASPQPGSVALAVAPAGAVTLFSDAACGTAATSIPLGVDARATFRFLGLSARTAAVTASFGGGSDVQQATVVAEGAASRLVFVSPPRVAVAGACSEEVEVRARDSFGNDVAAGGTVVGLASTPDRTFHAAADCSDSPVAGITLALGESAARFRVRSTVAQVAPLDASAAGLTSAAQDLSVLAAAPHHLDFETPARSVVAGACSAAITARLLDAFGNVATSPGLALDLSATPAAAGFHLDATCGGAVGTLAVPAGASGATFHVKGTIAGDVALEVSGVGLGLGTATQTATILPANRDHLVLAAGGGQAVAAGACSSEVRLEGRDVFGNPSGSGIVRTIALSGAGAPADLQLFAGPGCAGPAVTSIALGSGASQAGFSYRGRTAAPGTVGAVVSGWTAVDVPVRIVAASRVALALRSGGGQAPPAGTCSGEVTLSTVDAYGNPSAVGPAVTVALAATGGAPDLTLHAGPGCGAPAASIDLPGGTSDAVLSFVGTTAGPFNVTASVAGWTPLVVPEAVAPGPATALAWGLVPSPQYQAVPFSVSLVARDVYGNDAPSFAGTTALSGLGVALECVTGCAAAGATLPFTAGTWAGEVAVRPGATGARLVGSGGGLSGTSAPFDVVGAGPRSPPTARLTASPVALTSGQSVLLDATRSFDYQTLSQALTVSWDFGGTAGQPAGDPAQGWTAWGPWASAVTVFHAYGCGGPATCTFYPRVAIRDADLDVAYATVRVVVLPAAADLCVVTTGADVDDGATSCSDGALSLAEAIRLSNTTSGKQVITFSGPLTITGTGSYQIEADVDILAPPGVVLDGKALSVINTPAILVTGLELRNQPAPMVFPNKTRLTLEDVWIHDTAGVQAYGTATLRRVRMARCAGFCVQTDDPSGADTLTLVDSEFEDGGIAVHLGRCANGKVALDAWSTTFAGFTTAVDVGCPGVARIRNVTFHENATAIAYRDGSSHVLQNAIFTGQTVAAATCAGGVTFAPGMRERHLLFSNAAVGSCPLAGDPATLTGDPLYVFEQRRDVRLEPTSPAKDSAAANGLDLNGAAPGTYFGVGPDRGGRETY